jgi:serine phosphatase RsbU (regulator of sigma subunit)
MAGMPSETGGIFSPDMPTVYIIPIFAIIMGNVMTGFIYAFLMYAIIFGYYFAEAEGTIDFIAQTKNLPGEYYLFNLVLNALVILFLVFRNEVLRLKAVKELKESTEMIAVKNKEITDSINYARRIQSAILPQKEYVKQNLPDSFFLYQPKDIVSGDFYWMSERNGDIYLAVADCTGHGVPGAFMSVVGMNLLNEIVNHRDIFHPSEILKELNAGVVSSLQQKQTETNDGMDIALLKISTDKKSVEYAAANRGLIQFTNGELKEYKPSKYPIGGFNSMMEKSFETLKIEVKEGDMIYLSTDGYADQFGSDKNKKITTKKFKMLLESVSSKSLSEQENHLRDFINDWKRGYEQTDDILVVGIRF